MIFFTAFKKEWLEQRRTKKLLVALIVLTLFGMASPLLAKFTPQMLSLLPGGEAYQALIPQPTINDAVTQYLKNMSQFGILLALLFGMGSVASEKEKGTAALILSKPMPRYVFILAKYFAMSLVFLISFIIAGVSCYYYTYVLFGTLNPLFWLELNALLLLYILVYLALTVFFSTLTRTQYIAIGGAFGALILFGILGSLPGIDSYFPGELIAMASSLMNGGGISGWQSLWVSSGILCAALFGAILKLNRQEI